MDKEKVKKLLNLGMKFWEHFKEFEQKKKNRSMVQYEALKFISNKGKASMRDITDHIKTTMPSTTKLIDRLYASGFVKRIDDPKDRRVIFITLTKEGKAELKSRNNEMLNEMEELFTGISEYEIDVYMKIQEKIIANMKRQKSR